MKKPTNTRHDVVQSDVLRDYKTFSYMLVGVCVCVCEFFLVLRVRRCYTNWIKLLSNLPCVHRFTGPYTTNHNIVYCHYSNQFKRLTL